MELFQKDGALCSKLVKDFPLPEVSKIVEISATESVNSAFRKLVENKILSAPCWDEDKQEYLGFFDITDALALIYSIDMLVTAIPDQMLNKDMAKKLAESGNACPDSSELQVRSIFEDGKDDNFRSANDTEWNPVDEDTHMNRVVFLLATFTRRVPVIDKTTKRVTRILSQSLVTKVLNDALCEYEASNKPIPDLYNTTPIKSVGFGLTDVISVDADNNVARDAFRKIIETGVSSVAVVDENGCLLSSITTQDIRLFKSIEEVAIQRLTAEQRKREAEKDHDPKSHLATLDLTAGDFVSMVELTSTKIGLTKAPVAIVNRDCSVRKIISRLALTRKHRVYVCDEDRRPVGVISVSDVAKLIVANPDE